jgi:tRNA A-37 threonylcarbamoyl transferase component Bud32
MESRKIIEVDDLNRYLSNPDTYYVKYNVEHREYFMQKYIHQLKIVNTPDIVEYDEINKVMVMMKVGKNNLSHNYGEDANDIPFDLFDSVVKIVRTLVLYGIEYPDLTGYNFVEDVDTYGKIWIIDFEHATLTRPNDITNIHIKNICNGTRIWNPDFR